MATARSKSSRRARPLAPARIHTPQKRKDNKAVKTLENLLTHHDRTVPDFKLHDDWPGHDGYLDLMDDRGASIGKIFAQIKYKEIDPAIKRKPSLNFKDGGSFFQYCLNHENIPILCFVVDPNRQIAYWREMSREYIEGRNGIPSIDFELDTLIDFDHETYYERWKQISDFKIGAVRAYQEESRKSAGIRTSSPPPPLSEAQLQKAQCQIQKLFADTELKYKYYFAFVDLLDPFFLDHRSEENRLRLRSLFDITETQEAEFIKRMLREGLITKVGSLCAVVDKQKAVALLEEIIDRGTVELDLLIKLFP